MWDIGVWGDSITYGEGDTDALGWVGNLRKRLNEKCSVYNRGICGDTTVDVLKRFDIEVASIQPQTIVIAIGINDSKFTGGSEHAVSPDVFKKNMQHLIAKAQSVAKKVVIVGLTEVNEEKINSTSLFTNEAIREYDGYVREAATSAGVEFISMLGVLNIESDLGDGLHPNASGYKNMFSVIAEALISRKLLKEIPDQAERTVEQFLRL